MISKEDYEECMERLNHRIECLEELKKALEAEHNGEDFHSDILDQEMDNIDPYFNRDDICIQSMRYLMEDVLYEKYMDHDLALKKIRVRDCQDFVFLSSNFDGDYGQRIKALLDDAKQHMYESALKSCFGHDGFPEDVPKECPWTMDEFADQITMCYYEYNKGDVILNKLNGKDKSNEEL